MGRGAGGSVSCVSDVYSNTAQAGLYTADSFHKHETEHILQVETSSALFCLTVRVKRRSGAPWRQTLTGHKTIY